MFEEGWLSLTLEEGPLTRDVPVKDRNHAVLVESHVLVWMVPNLMEQTLHHLAPSTLHHCAYQHNQQEMSHHFPQAYLEQE